MLTLTSSKSKRDRRDKERADAEQRRAEQPVLAEGHSERVRHSAILLGKRSERVFSGMGEGRKLGEGKWVYRCSTGKWERS